MCSLQNNGGKTKPFTTFAQANLNRFGQMEYTA